MANKIKIRRGQKAKLPLPNTELWELRYAHDTSELFIDDGVDNVLIGSKTSNPANIAWTESYRAVTDTEKAAWNGKVNSSDVVITATANKILKLDANAKLPANITGNADGNSATATKLQTVRTINGVSFDGSADITINAVDSTSRIASSEKGIANGVATLDNTGKVPSSQLPSYVDDVLEYATYAGFPATGESGKIYVALNTNLAYRWGGSNYVEISPSIALGEASETAYRGDRGKVAYDHSQLTGGTNPHNTTFANISSKPTTIAGYGITDGVTLTGTQTLTNKTISSPVITGTPTGITATHVGLGNVTNNAQVKKIASSTDNAIMRFDGTTGDLPQNSLATISDTGTVNIPTGQNYNINGVALKDVSETLTNKTLTSPTVNGEATGSAVSTTGGANKLVKTSSLGNISMTQSVDGNVGFILNNTSTGTNANTGISTKSNLLNYCSLLSYGSGRTISIFGKTVANYSAVLSQGADNAGMLLGTLSSSPLIIGTAGVERYNMSSNGIHTFTTPATTSYNAIFRNSSYATTDTSGTSSIKLGYLNHDGVKIEAYKTSFNVSGIKFYGEYGFGTEKLLATFEPKYGTATFLGGVQAGGAIQINSGSGNNLVLTTTGGAGVIVCRDSSSVENIRLDGNTARFHVGNSTVTELNSSTPSTCRAVVYGSLGVRDASDNRGVWIAVDSANDTKNMLNFRRGSGDTVYRVGVRSDGNALIFGDSGIERLAIHKAKYIDYVEEGINGKFFAGRLNGTYTAPTAVLAGDVVGTFGCKGQIGTTAYNYAVGGVMSFVATGNYTGLSNAPTDLVISLTTTSSAATEKLRLTSVGTLLLGHTSNPALGTFSNPAKIAVSDNSSTTILVKSYSSNVAEYCGIMTLGKSRSSTIGQEIATLSGDTLGHISFEGVGNTNLVAVGAEIKAIQTGNSGKYSVPSDLVFVTANGSSRKEVMRITQDKKVNFTTNEIKIKPYTTSGLVAGTWYNVCESHESQPDDVIMVNLACFISSGNNHSALIAVTKAAGFYGTATTIASQNSGLVPSYTFRFNAGYLQISFNATNLPSNFNAHTIARFS